VCGCHVRYEGVKNMMDIVMSDGFKLSTLGSELLFQVLVSFWSLEGGECWVFIAQDRLETGSERQQVLVVGYKCAGGYTIRLHCI